MTNTTAATTMLPTMNSNQRTSSGGLSPAALAVLGGLLLCAGWMPWPTALTVPLLFVAWVPYLLLERRLTQLGARKGRVFAHTYLMLLLWNALTTWWVSYASLPAGIAAVVLNALLMCLPLMAFRQTHKRLGYRWGYALLPVYWIAFEQLHLHWDITWPWLTLGNGFAAAPNWVQWYEYTGFLGGSVWVWMVNLLMFRAWLKVKESSNQSKAQLAAKNPALSAGSIPTFTFLFLTTAIPALFAVSIPIGISLGIGSLYQEKGPTEEVVVVQPNFDPYVEKFEGGPKFIPYDEQLTRLLALSEQHLTPATRLIIWPETALEEAMWENTIESTPRIRRIREWLGRHPGVALLTGLTTINSYPSKEMASETARYSDQVGYYDFNNAAGYFASAAAPLAIYHKSRLVPGTEKIPPILSSVLKGIDLGGFVGSYGSQTERTVFAAPANAPALRVAPVICYESIYGDFVNQYPGNGATLLGLFTNDAWWHDSPGYRQLLSYGQLRCIETRRDLARSANTGFTGFINQKGEITQREPAWVPTASRALVHLNDEVTFYARYGELIGRGAQLLAVLGLLAAVVLGWNRKRTAGV
jgi:apolipoprotein N-acyltransferase